ncbi:hypothetical protein [Metabacillus litoralis]|uniref:hypothetical protein n=1 Tax=Metabacillus litoralis TaxID=152268 RepID=UPI00203B96E0|nr:hypothetical protein [Metabacillus litoralis]MCM3163691.1 hypothetical protein [Metabacillus litoralis]
MFPSVITQRDQDYHLIDTSLSQSQLKQLLTSNPYDIFAVVNEGHDQSEEDMFTTFLVLHSAEFDNRVILYDISRQAHTTITTEISFLSKGYIEFIDVGMVDRYPVKLYKRIDAE